MKTWPAGAIVYKFDAKRERAERNTCKTQRSARLASSEEDVGTVLAV